MNFTSLKANIDTRLVLNVGSPIAKTNAPYAYNRLFCELGMNALMIPVEIPRGKLESFMRACKTLNIRYFSPTMPHKADIIRLLDNVDETSRLFRSVNAVRIDDDGVSHGAGMDGRGAVSAMKDCGIELRGRKAFLLGTGSISGVIGLELAKNGVTELIALNRTLKSAEEIAGLLNSNTAMNVTTLAATPENLDLAAAKSDLFLQCTPLGMTGFDATHEYTGFVGKMPHDGVVFDAVINPPDTPVIKAAKNRGLKTVPGMRMLAGQIGEIFNFMFGVTLTQENKEACIQELCTHLGLKTA
jgi:shikimate dehydrogenase